MAEDPGCSKHVRVVERSVYLFTAGRPEGAGRSKKAARPTPKYILSGNELLVFGKSGTPDVSPPYSSSRQSTCAPTSAESQGRHGEAPRNNVASGGGREEGHLDRRRRVYEFGLHDRLLVDEAVLTHVASVHVEHDRPLGTSGAIDDNQKAVGAHQQDYDKKPFDAGQKDNEGRVGLCKQFVDGDVAMPTKLNSSLSFGSLLQVPADGSLHKLNYHAASLQTHS